MSGEAFSPLVLVMAGGTGGHVFPALAIARALQQKSASVQWLGTERGIEARLVPDSGIELHCLSVQGLRGKGLLKRGQSLLKAVASLFAAIRLIRRLDPACVIGLGGYVAGPGGIAAWLTRKPLIIHEQNAVAGTTNRLLARFAKRVLTGYPIALGGSRNTFIGNPVRESISALPPPDARFAGRKGALQLLVLGGSQGAMAINQVVVEALKSLSRDQVNVWHQTGAAHIDGVRAGYLAAGVDARVEAFIDDMAAAYAQEKLQPRIIEAFAQEKVDLYGAADLLLNNAGVGLVDGFLDTTAKDWDWLVGHPARRADEVTRYQQ